MRAFLNWSQKIAVSAVFLMSAGALSDVAACVAISGTMMVNTCNEKIKVAYSTSQGACSSRYPAPSGCGKTLMPRGAEAIAGTGRVEWKYCNYDDWKHNRCSLAQ